MRRKHRKEKASISTDNDIKAKSGDEMEADGINNRNNSISVQEITSAA